jgi:hypothetical protein
VGLSLTLGMERGYVAKDARKWYVDTEKDIPKFDAEN